MNHTPANSSALEIAGRKRSESWTPARWLAVIAFVFATHVALIFLFGAKKEMGPLAMNIRVPALTLANDSDELFALNDPTLFALPHQWDLDSAGLKTPAVRQPEFRYTEMPQPLPFATDSLGAAFSRFMPANFWASQPRDFKSSPELSAPTLPVEPALAQNSTMQIEGELAPRQLPVQISLTNWPYPDVIAPSKVQVLVDTAGNVVSTVLLPPDSGFAAADYYAAADQRALELARTLRFTPSPRLAFGRVIFNWHTVPPTASP